MSSKFRVDAAGLMRGMEYINLIVHLRAIPRATGPRARFMSGNAVRVPKLGHFRQTNVMVPYSPQ